MEETNNEKEIKENKKEQQKERKGKINRVTALKQITLIEKGKHRKNSKHGC